MGEKLEKHDTKTVMLAGTLHIALNIRKKIHLFWGIAHYLVFLHYFSNFETLSGLMKVRALYENGWYQKEKVDV